MLGREGGISASGPVKQVVLATDDQLLAFFTKSYATVLLLQVTLSGLAGRSIVQAQASSGPSQRPLGAALLKELPYLSPFHPCCLPGGHLRHAAWCLSPGQSLCVSSCWPNSLIGVPRSDVGAGRLRRCLARYMGSQGAC